MQTVARPSSAERAHYYRRDGTPVFSVPNKSSGGDRPTTIRDCRSLNLVPSPTTITKLLHRQALVEWQIEQSVLAVLSAPRKENETLDAYVERILHVERHQDQERDAAAERGKSIHRAIQLALETGMYDEAFYAFVRPALALMAQFGRVVACEKRIIADDYVGTTDLILENDHEMWVWDIKCRRRIPEKQYDEEKLQLSAYAGGLGNTGDKRIRCANLYLSTEEPGKLDLKESVDWRKDFERFRLLLSFWKLTNGL